MNCKNCGKPVSAVEQSLNYKLISRNAMEFLCTDCLCKRFSTTKEALYELAVDLKKKECLLFRFSDEVLETIKN